MKKRKITLLCIIGILFALITVGCIVAVGVIPDISGGIIFVVIVTGVISEFCFIQISKIKKIPEEKFVTRAKKKQEEKEKQRTESWGNRMKRQSIKLYNTLEKAAYCICAILLITAAFDSNNAIYYVVGSAVSIVAGGYFSIVKDNLAKKDEKYFYQAEENARMRARLTKEYKPSELNVCPICGEHECVEIKWKSFSKTKAAIGILITDKCYGALWGIPSNKRVTAVCNNCHSKFKVINK